MKKAITILIIIVFASCKAQEVNINTLNQGDNTGKYFKDLDNNFQPFIGTWDYVYGNTTFRVLFYKTEMKSFGSYTMDVIEGSFLIIENADTLNENIIHNSIIFYPNSGQTSTSVIWGVSTDAIILNASIDDNSIDFSTGILNGKLTFEIINNSNQAQWTVTKTINIEGHEFNIPTNTILTKQ
ncbi:MAG: DUF6705 family protein [Flavobacteriaceae bacterium]